MIGLTEHAIHIKENTILQKKKKPSESVWCNEIIQCMIDWQKYTIYIKQRKFLNLYQKKEFINATTLAESIQCNKLLSFE